jgi:hypothetical protein
LEMKEEPADDREIRSGKNEELVTIR